MLVKKCVAKARSFRVCRVAASGGSGCTETDAKIDLFASTCLQHSISESEHVSPTLNWGAGAARSKACEKQAW